MIATRIFSPGTAGQVIAYNGVLEDGEWGGHLNVLLRNALDLLDRGWRAPGWFSTVCAETPNATASTLPIVYDARRRCPLIQEGVTWQIGLGFDAGFADVAELYPNPRNTYRGKLTIDHNDLGQDRIAIPIRLAIDASMPHRLYLPCVMR